MWLGTETSSTVVWQCKRLPSSAFRHARGNGTAGLNYARTCEHCGQSTKATFARRSSHAKAE